MTYYETVASGPRPYLLMEANLKQLQADPPKVAILPWGATEAHNYHMPHGTDVIEATVCAQVGAKLASERGAKVVVLPTIPFGNNAQQLDQVSTIHFRTTTAYAILQDVCASLTTQGIDRLVILNYHGGNEFKPLIRDLQLEYKMLVVQVHGFGIAGAKESDIFKNPGDHAGDAETSLILHICPQLVQMENAGPGKSVPFDIACLKQPGVWTPRPWSKCQPDTGAGDPREATADKGKRFLTAIGEALAKLLVELSNAKKGQLPYV
jgi:creatinine amidohydrolase